MIKDAIAGDVEVEADRKKKKRAGASVSAMYQPLLRRSSDRFDRKSPHPIAHLFDNNQYPCLKVIAPMRYDLKQLRRNRMRGLVAQTEDNHAWKKMAGGGKKVSKIQIERDDNAALPSRFLQDVGIWKTLQLLFSQMDGFMTLPGGVPARCSWRPPCLQETSQAVPCQRMDLLIG